MRNLLNYIICLPLGILMSGPFAIVGTCLGFLIGSSFGFVICMAAFKVGWFH